jgi:hypothetical protein
MLTCPMCKKSVHLAGRECPTCRADLSLLVDYVDGLEEGLARADAATRAGELGDAVWAYLAVLEIDPDNPTARRQVGQVAAAVRQFDRIALGRRWLDKLQRRARFRHWAESWGRDGRGVLAGLLVAAVLMIFVAGAGAWWFGFQEGRQAAYDEVGLERLPMPEEVTEDEPGG